MKLKPIYVVSGGTGASGEQLVRTVLVQFPDSHVPLIVVNHVRQIEQIQETISEIAAHGGIIVHTMVDADLRKVLIDRARAQGVIEIDLMGPLISQLTGILVDPAQIHSEVETARAICRRHSFSVLDVTDKPIEASADEIVELITRRLGSKAHQRP